jgi:hypothetical protein
VGTVEACIALLWLRASVGGCGNLCSFFVEPAGQEGGAGWMANFTLSCGHRRMAHGIQIVAVADVSMDYEI